MDHMCLGELRFILFKFFFYVFYVKSVPRAGLEQTILSCGWKMKLTGKHGVQTTLHMQETLLVSKTS